MAIRSRPSDRSCSIATALASLLLASSLASWADDKPRSSAPAAERMRAAAESLLAALPVPLKARARRPFDDPDRLDWHYTPRSRNGVSFKDLDARGRDTVHALLKTALSAAGHRKVVNIIELESVLREHHAAARGTGHRH